MKNLEKEFVPYQPSVDMKELGFDEPCFGLYHNDKTFYPTQCKSHEQFHGQVCSAPLYQQAFRWFREKHGLFVAPNVISYEGGPYLWFFEINSIILLFGTDLGETDDYNTYEEAELACLKKLIEIVKK